MTIHRTVLPKTMLNVESQELSRNIHQKENLVKDLFEDSKSLETLRNAETFPLEAEKIIAKYAKDHMIFLFVYKYNNPIQWSTNVYVPQTDIGIFEGTSFLADANRYFVAKKKTIGSTSLLALIPIKRNFPENNQYLQNDFYSDLNISNNIEIANFYDVQQVENIYSSDKNLLFSVKLKEGKLNNIFTNLEIVMWILGIITLITLINTLCLDLAKRGYLWSSVLLFGLFLAGIRYIELTSNWLTRHVSSPIFEAKNYALNSLFPNLGAMLVFYILIFWFMAYCWSLRRELEKTFTSTNKWVVLPINFMLYLSIYIAINLVYNNVATIITFAKAVTDLTQIFALTTVSWVGIGIFCITTASIIFYVDIVKKLSKCPFENKWYFLSFQVCIWIVSLVLSSDPTLYLASNSVIFLLIIVRIFPFENREQYKLGLQLIYILIIASLASVKHANYTTDKIIQDLKLGIKSLEAEDDLNAIALFSDIEYKLPKDKQLKGYFSSTGHVLDQQILREYIHQTYLSGYLSKFDYEAYFYDYNNEAVGKYQRDEMLQFRENVINKSIKVSENFYRLKGELGTHQYFAQFKIPLENEREATVLIKLVNKAFSYSVSYPDILTDSRLNTNYLDLYKKNSFVIYKDGNIIHQNGSYSYPLKPENISLKLHTFKQLPNKDGYIQLMYRPDVHTVIVMGTKQISFWVFLATTSSFFIILFITLAISNLIIWCFRGLKDKNFQLKYLKYNIYIIRNKIQFSSRIQLYFILSVICSLLLSGVISFVSINKQLNQNNENSRIRYIREISKRVESTLNNDNGFENLTTLSNYLNLLSRSISTDFTLYNQAGYMIYSSQPKIYDSKLQSRFMNPEAYIALHKLHRAEVLQNEVIGTFKYPATYTSIRNSDLKTVAYLGIPFYSADKDTETSQNILFNTLINIYALILLIIGFIAAFLAKQITSPLNIIRRKLSETGLGSNNEPIFWKRNDEIGALIKEYNIMILKLDSTAKKLVRAERETAWREMAQQIAHEIKNPLTPMKLGIQQLSRSYHEDDARFPERFDRVTKSFIEQIDTLSHIATEFSAFAKLPETKLQRINLLEKIIQSINVYENNDNTNIALENLVQEDKLFVMGDADQILRLFNNLIKNAVEAALSKKRIYINIKIASLTEDQLEINVKDNGIGISEEAQQKIFVPNFTTKSSGTGLGLAFAKQTVEGMGGTISYETREGKGTTFILIIPRIVS